MWHPAWSLVPPWTSQVLGQTFPVGGLPGGALGLAPGNEGPAWSPGGWGGPSELLSVGRGVRPLTSWVGCELSQQGGTSCRGSCLQQGQSQRWLRASGHWFPLVAVAAIVLEGGGRGGMDWEFGVNRWRLSPLEWISNEILLCSIGNYV